jgi:hypothetical protein
MARAKRKSDVGTAMARMNDAYFGMASDAPVIPGVESMEEWQAHRDALVADRAPVGALEQELAERMASLLWRLRRPARYEREYIAASIERVPEDFIRRGLSRSLPRTIKDADERVETADRGLQLLEVLGDAPLMTEVLDKDIEAIFEALSDDPELSELLEKSIPGFEEGIANAGDWAAPLLRVAFREIARRADMEPTEVLHRAIVRLSAYRDERVEERAAMLAEQDRMRRERSLPEAGTLHALTRYESTLHRQLMQLMHEFEAAQARRRGETTPLLRGDIHLITEK